MWCYHGDQVLQDLADMFHSSHCFSVEHILDRGEPARRLQLQSWPKHLEATVVHCTNGAPQMRYKA